MPAATVEDGFDMAVCLDRVRQRDEAAARELMTRLYPLVIKIVRAHLPRRMSEEDLAQEIFLKMFTRLSQYQGPLPFEHWLSRVAVTTCLDALRAQGRRPELRWADLSQEQAMVLDSVHSSAPAPAERSGRGARELVDQLMESLSAEDRLVLTLLDLEERSVAEVRELTGWNASLIKVRAFRARRKLRKHLEHLEKQSPAAYEL